MQAEKDYLSSPSFKPEIIRSKSGAAAGLCSWVVNICKYFRIYQVHALPSTRVVVVKPNHIIQCMTSSQAAILSCASIDRCIPARLAGFAL